MNEQSKAMALSPALQNVAKLKRLAPAAHVATGIAISILFVAQIAIGTSAPFAALVALYGILSWITVATMGGPFTVGGFLITITAFVHVLFGQVVKTLLREPPDIALLVPIETMSVCCLSMLGFLLAGILFRIVRMEKWQTVLPDELDPKRLRMIGLILILACTAAILFQMVMMRPDTAQIGGLFSITRTLSRAYPLAASLIAAYAIVSKKRLMTPGVIACIAFGIFQATINGSRNEFLETLVIIMLTALFYLYKPKVGEVIALATLLLFYQHFYTPFAINERANLRKLPIAERITTSFATLGSYVVDLDAHNSASHIIEARLPYDKKRTYYYTSIKKNATLDRFTLLPVIDSVVAGVIDKPAEGPNTTIWGLRLLVPNVLDRDKPILSTGNFVAHKGRGLVNPEDHVTQISMGFTPDALMSYGLLGVVGTCLLLGAAFIGAHRFLFGNYLINNGLAIGIVLAAAHTFCEGTIAAQLQRIFTEAPIMCIFLLLMLWTSNSITKKRLIDRLEPVHQ